MVVSKSLLKCQQESKQLEIVNVAFNHFQSLVLRQAKLSADDKESTYGFKDSLGTYVETLCQLADGAYSHLVQDARPVIQVLVSAGFSDYGFMACALCIAKSIKQRSININD